MGSMLLARVVGYFSFGGADAIQYVYLAGELLVSLRELSVTFENECG